MYSNYDNTNNERHTLSGSDSDLVGNKRQLLDKNIIPSTVLGNIDPASRPINKFDIAIAWLTDSYIPCEEDCNTNVASVPRQRMFQSYHDYCESNSLESLSSRSFGKLVIKQFPGLKIKRIGKREISTYHYCGITFKTRVEKDRVENHDERRNTHLPDIPVESTIPGDPQQSNDIFINMDTSACQPPRLQETSTEYLLWLHASHCATVVHCLGRWQFDVVEDELREFWLMERAHLNCNSFHNTQHFNLFLLAEVQAYQDAVAALQMQLCDALSPDRVSMVVTFVERLERMHRNTNCYIDELRGCLGYFIHLMTRYAELAKITRLIDTNLSEVAIISAMYATWSTSLNFDSIVKRCITLYTLHICSNVSSKILTDLMLKNDINLTNFFLLKAWFDDYVGLTTLRNMTI
ncbi:hypothetical protein E3Q16_00982 [Wallemia mellicola]|nr:hypothetical protein E3Q16_00982 [Wallemia mellicola]